MYRLLLITICLGIPNLGSAQNAVSPLSFGGLLGGHPATPWKIVRKDGEARLVRIESVAGPAVRMECDNASFSIQRGFKASPHMYPVLSWSWRADALPPRGDVRRSDRNDQVLQLFVLFERRGGGYKAISYIWDSNAPVNTSTHENWDYWIYRVDVKTLVLESGTENLLQWRRYQRNVLADYRGLYGEEPQEIVGVRLQTNCQHTDSKALGYFGEPQFAKQ